MLRILSIGNSFSQDAHVLLSAMAESAGTPVETGNLYIPGCSLRRHWDGVAGDNRDALYEQNGATTERHISISEALSLDDWDLITFQQSSGHSGQYETYFPYLRLLSALAASRASHARQYLHETWAYEQDSGHPHFSFYGHSQRRMFEALREANRRAGALMGMPVIPSGELLQALRALPSFDVANGGRALTRDGFHLDLIYGRWAVSALWLDLLCRVDARTIPFVPAGADRTLLQTIAGTVHQIAGENRSL